MAALRACDDGQALMEGFFVGLEHSADAGSIYADRLFGEDGFAGGDSRFQMKGPETGRGRQDDVVGLAAQDTLVGIQTLIASAVAQLNRVAELLDAVALGELGQPLPTAFERC